jgi:hypothetical protein
VGRLVFVDYTFVESPKTVDVNGDRVSLDQFNIGRVYFNVTGSLSPRISFRVTPEVTRATGFVTRSLAATETPKPACSTASAALTFEEPRVTAGFYELFATDRAARDAPRIDSHGWTAWVNPRLANGWELLARLDRLTVEPSATGRKLRTIDGVAYWFHTPASTSAAVMADVEQTTSSGGAIPEPADRRFALHVLLGF